jgi:capsular exopolysaccharide synthesis family protein
MQGRYGDRHPDLLKAKRQLADMDAQIQAEIRRIVSNLEAQVTVARERTASMAASAARAKGNLAANNQASVRLNELERNAEAARALYNSFLNRFKETTAQQGFEAPDARVLSQAKIPGWPSSPNKQLNLLIALVLAVGAGLGAAVLAEALDSGLGTAEDVERRMHLTYLGSIPTLESTLKAGPLFKSKIPPVDFVVEKPLSSFAEAFRNLRAAVLFSRTGESVKVIAITSSLPGEGKTTTSLALARTMAIAGSSTIILDCDLRRRGISRFLSGEPVNGLIEVLNGTCVLEQALVRDGASGAMILPLARSAYTAKDVFRTPAMRRLLEGLRRRFDVVVLDTAPVLPVADTRILAAMADTVVVLTRWRKTPRKAMESTLRILKSTTANIAGVALTQVDLKMQAKTGYGDPGYYYQSYKKYYTE